MGQKKLNSPIVEWQEGAGGLLLLAAAHETALLSQLEDVLPMKQPSAAVSQPSPQRLFYPHRRLLLTLLFLPAVGLHRFWELRSYTGRELALLTGRPHPYSYRHTERFLLQLSASQADQALTKALARLSFNIDFARFPRKLATLPGALSETASRIIWRDIAIHELFRLADQLSALAL